MTDVTREKTRAYFGFGIKRMKEIKVCEICAAAVGAEKRICPKCHTKLPCKTLYDIYKSNQRVCIKCETVLPKFAEYCPECGERQVKSPKLQNADMSKIAL